MKDNDIPFEKLKVHPEVIQISKKSNISATLDNYRHTYFKKRPQN